MKRTFFTTVSIFFVFVFLLTSCNTVQQTTIAPNPNPEATSTPAVNPEVLSATETAFADRIRPARGQATPTATLSAGAKPTPAGTDPNATQPVSTPQKPGQPTPAVSNAKVTPAAAQATAAPSATLPIPTQAAISTIGGLPIPGKKLALDFGSNGVITAVSNTLSDGVSVAYQLTTSAGQLVYLAIYGQTNLQIYDSKQVPVTQNKVMPGYLSFITTDAGLYTIVLRGLGSVTMSVYLPAATSNLASAAPLPAQPQAVKLPVMPLSVSFYNKLEPTVPVGYTFSGQAGQNLSLLVSGSLTATLLAPDGNTVATEIDTIGKTWSFKFPETGTYTLIFSGSGVTDVTAKITAPPTGATLAAPQAGGNTPILIAPDSSSISFSTYLVQDKPQIYLLHISANQVLYVDASGSVAITSITGPGNTPVTLNHSSLSTRWGGDIAQEGDYLITIAGKGPSNLVFSLPTKQIIP